MNTYARSAFLLLFVVFSIGCNSPKGKPQRERIPPQPVLVAEQVFAKTGLLVSAEVGPFHRPRPEGSSDDGPSSDRPDGNRPDRSSRDRGDRPAPGERRGGAGDGPRSGGRVARTAPMRQVLTVSVSNPTDAPVHLRVAEVRSILGSFVPVPSTFTLEPGQSQTLETMRASYPVNLSALDLTIRIRTAETNETQVLTLGAEPSPPPES